MFKKLLVFFISLLVGFGLLTLTVGLIGWQEIISAFLIFTGWQGLIILLLTVLILFFSLWKWQVILKSQGYNLPLSKLAGPYLASFSLIYLFPVVSLGGEIFRGYILKEKFAIPWKNGITSIFIDKMLEITSSLIAILLGMIFFIFKVGFPINKLEIISGVFLLIFSALLGFVYFKIFRKESVIKMLAKFFNHKKLLNWEILDAEKEIFVFFKARKNALLLASFLTFLRVAATWLRCWLLVLFLGKSIGFLTALSILGFYYIVASIPIPAALGAHELIQAFSFNALGLGAGTALAFAMIQRGAELILAFTGLAIFLKIGLEMIKTILFRRLESLVDKG